MNGPTSIFFECKLVYSRAAIHRGPSYEVIFKTSDGNCMRSFLTFWKSSELEQVCFFNSNKKVVFSLESEECGALEVTRESDRQSTEPQWMIYERFEASFRAPQRSGVLVSTFSNTRHTKTSIKRIYTLEFSLKRSLNSRFLLFQTLEISRFNQNTSDCTRNSTVRIFIT